jgi:uncharacterized membrane protein
MNTEVRFLAQHLLHAGLNPLSARDRRVIARVARRVHTARNLNQVFDDRLTMGQRWADKVATIGGSWSFIAGFSVFLVAWAALNTLVLAGAAFDPYPFVFLNLILSMLAAVQAPVIMMSQNRQAAKDRLAAALDYEVNVKAEIAISGLHDKVDRLQAQIAQLVALRQAANDDRERVRADRDEEAAAGRPALAAL